MVPQNFEQIKCISIIPFADDLLQVAVQGMYSHNKRKLFLVLPTSLLQSILIANGMVPQNSEHIKNISLITFADYLVQVSRY